LERCGCGISQRPCAGAIAIANGNGLNDTDSLARPVNLQCFQTASYAAPANQARGILAGAKVNYVMDCGPRSPDDLLEPACGRRLWGRLQAGAAPDWLEPVPDTQLFAVYRVRF
jgi:hypothetical protein